MNYEMKKYRKQITKKKVYFNQNISRQRLLTASTSQKSETKDLSFVLIYHLCCFFFSKKRYFVTLYLYVCSLQISLAKSYTLEIIFSS